MATKNVIDLMAEAAKNKDLIDEFKAATSAKDLQKRWSTIRPGYDVGEEDCNKLFDAKKNILDALQTLGPQGFY